MNKYDILEECLQAIDKGQDPNSVLARYPDQARELRPLLETAMRARTLSGTSLPVQFQKRDRSRLLQRAADMRLSKQASRQRKISFFSRLAISLGVAGAMILSSTGLVSASSNSIPGDQLYPVKRTWEGVRLMFVFSPQEREVLQSQYEQERLNEIDELLVQGRHSTPITFSGLVTRRQDGSWMVSGIPVLVSSSTVLPNDTITNSAPVIVIGITRNDGAVEAQEIQLLQPGAPLPPFEPSGNSEHANSNRPSSTGPALPPSVGTPAPQSSAAPTQNVSYEFSGVVESIQEGIWTINGQSVHVDQSDVNGNVSVGSAVKFQGYYDDNGEFIASNLQLISNAGSTPAAHHDNNGNGQGNNDNSGKNNNGTDSGGGDNGVGTPPPGDH